MNIKNVFIEKISNKRLFSMAIDIFVALIPTILVYYLKIIPENIDINSYALFWIIFTLMTMIITVITKYGTIGDVYLKLRIVDVKNDKLSMNRLLLRNFSYCIYLGIFILADNELVYLITAVITTLILYFIMYSNNNNYKEYMNVCDFIFKTKVVDANKVI